MSRLAGKVALVLGAAGADNMGQTIARRFRDEGADVIVAGRGRAELDRLAGELGGLALTCDITDRAAVAAMARDAQAWRGRLDVAVNATGWGLLQGFLETTPDELARMIALQFAGPFAFFQEVVRAMMANDPPGGSIIQISSATATIMLNDHAAYMGTKAGTDHVVRCVAHEFGQHGIRANSISPGLTETPMTAGAATVPGLFESFLAGYPLGRIGTKADIAAAAVWLASDECFMTGENLQVNGGLTLRRNPTREETAAAIAAAGRGVTPAIGMASGVTPELSPPDTIMAAAAGGFASVGLWVEPAEWTAATTRAVCERTRDTGLSVIDVEVVWIKPGPIDPALFRILDIGGEVGARHALVVSSDPDMAATTAKFAALCDHAAPIGITVALEFGLFTDVKTIHAAAAILRAVDHPAMRLLADTLHLDRSGGGVADLAAVPRAWLGYAQICDAPAPRPAPDDADAIFEEAVWGRLLPGEGTLDLDGFIAALPDSLPLSVELRSRALYDAYPDCAERARALAATTRRYFAARAARLAATAAMTGAGSK